MSFSGQSNPPWQRNNINNVIQGQLGNSAVGQIGNTGMAFHQGSGQMFLQQGQQNMGYNHGSMQGSGGGSGGGMYQQGGGGGSSSISYPPVRTGLNPVAFQNSTHGGTMQGQSHHRGQQQQQHYNSIGTITKINADCGLVNEEVFFYRNVCKGYIPKLGDRVLFESTFSPNGQFKWNATRIQLMPQPGLNSSQPTPLMASTKKGAGSGYNAVPPPNEYQHLRAQQQRKASPRRSSPIGRDRNQRSERERRDRERSPRRRDIDDQEENDRKRRREEHGRSKERTRSVTSRSDRDRDRDRNRDDSKREQDQIIMERRKALSEREREREREQREREREKNRDRSRDRGGVSKYRNIQRAIRRYTVQIPKISLVITSADVQQLRERYSILYIPSDFFHADIKWPRSFTHDKPFSLRRPCKFHIKNKLVEPPGGVDPHSAELLEPEDADYLYSAKVMLMACPPITELYQKSFEAEDDNENEQHSVHPSRLISFLVGTRGRNEPMAIGGPWSPSMDGENPDKDPTVLIRTAIRTCKALTGIDLSNCTQWYRFLELYYHRTDHKNKDQDAPPRIETVVIYLPDVHSCVPTVSEWEQLSQSYKTALENVISAKTEGSKQTSASSGADGMENASLANDFNNCTTEGALDVEAEMEVDDAAAQNNQQTEDAARSSNATEDQNEVNEISADANEKDENELEPTHYSELDLKTMKVQDIRNELMARKLPSRGLRNVLMARLAKALNAEKEEEEANASTDDKTELNEVDGADEVIYCDSDDNTADVPQDTKADSGDAKDSQSNHADSDPIAEEEQEAEDEQEDWANVDMNDIVILDEYDSSKNPEEPKEFDEKEKTHLTRRYLLPSTPQVIVHPSKIAKGGKFDCTTMSLSVLLDYRPEDTKERFFEVSLFAELFNEMLMRDFGFNIYKALYLHKEGNLNEGSDHANEPSNKDENKSNADEEKSAKDKNGENLGGESKAKERRISKVSLDADPNDDDSQSINTSADRKRKASEKNSADKKTFIVKPQLLLSFTYFDTTHCGYIFEKDLEDLFSILGLNLSRGQIRKVLGKSSSRQTIYYRKLTDKEDLIDAPPSIEESEDITSEELNKIASGNKQYYPIFNYEDNTESTNNDIAGGESSGLATYNGAVIHVGKLVEQIKRTETSYSNLEKLYNDLLKQYGDLQKEHSKSSGKMKELQSEVRSLNRKISDSDQDLYTINRKYKEQNATLSYIYNRVAPYFTREKDHKSESSRDKDAREDKHKEKDNDKTQKDINENKDDGKDNTNAEKERPIDEKEKSQPDSAADGKEQDDKKGENKKGKDAEK